MSLANISIDNDTGSGNELSGATLTALTRTDTSETVTLPSPATFTYDAGGDTWDIAVDIPSGVVVEWEADVTFTAGGTSGTDGEVIAAVSDAGGAADGSITLATARTWVLDAIRDGSDTSAFGTASVDRAIIYAGQYFCRETKAVRRAISIAITEGDDSPNLSTAIADGFTPERRIDAIISGKCDPLKFVDFSEINRMAAESSSTGTPLYVAFLGAGVIKLYPEPDADLTLYLRYWQPFTSIVPGVTSGSTLLNIAAEHVPYVFDGAAAYLLSPSIERVEGSAQWAKFLAHIERLKGAGSLGSRLIQRRLPEEICWRREIDPDLI